MWFYEIVPSGADVGLPRAGPKILLSTTICCQILELKVSDFTFLPVISSVMPEFYVFHRIWSTALL